ncbi:MAG: orotidine 5'-phosphate decarboxylase [Methanoculleus sp. SDB]|nr:MAG: orotidine 5'-phosphate decarboxylase [Methanoculleus sp. SDB]
MTDLILALDVTGPDEALAIAEVCAPLVDRIKLGYPLILAAGLGIAGEIAAFGCPLIADFKVADIPNTNRLIAEQVFDAGFSALITHAFTGSDSVSACVEVAHNNGGECYVVAEMSHPGAVEFFHGGTAERLAETAVLCGADGIIAPATRPDRIRALRQVIGERKILSPGVGVQGGRMEEVQALVDGVIVGRSIYGAPDPAAAARSFGALRR